jgi:hypothetical protein
MMYNITAAGLVVATLATSMLYLRRGALCRKMARKELGNEYGIWVQKP